MQQYSTLLSQIWGTYSIIIPKPESSWWFQPLWKILVKLGNLPQVGVEIRNIWNHHPVNDQAKAFLGGHFPDSIHLRWRRGPGENRSPGICQSKFPNFRTLSNDIQKKNLRRSIILGSCTVHRFIYIHGQVERHHGKRHLYHLLWGKYVEETHSEHNNHTIIHHVYITSKYVHTKNTHIQKYVFCTS